MTSLRHFHDLIDPEIITITILKVPAIQVITVQKKNKQTNKQTNIYEKKKKKCLRNYIFHTFIHKTADEKT